MEIMQYKFSTSKTLTIIIIYFLLFLAGDFINSLIFDFIFSIIKLPGSGFYIMPRMTGCLLLTIFFFRLYTEKALHLNMRTFGITFNIKKWGVLYAVLLPSFVVAVFLGFGKVERNPLAVSNVILITAASIITALKAGILEEMLFRGFIMKLLENRWNKYIAILIPSFIFSLVHIPSMQTFTAESIVLLIISGTLVGSMFSLIAYKGKSISNSALMHALWNFVLVTDIFHITTVQDAYGEPIFPLTLSSDNILLTGAGFGVEASLVAIIGYLFVCAIAIRGRKTAPDYKGC